MSDVAYIPTVIPGALAAYSKEEAGRLIDFLGLNGWVPFAIGEPLLGWRFDKALVIVGRSTKSEAEMALRHEWVAHLRSKLSKGGELRLA